VGIGGTALFFRVPGGKGVCGTMRNGFAKRCRGAPSDGPTTLSGVEMALAASSSRAEPTATAAMGLQSSLTADIGAPRMRRSSLAAKIVAAGAALKPATKGQLQVYALLLHPRFSRLCVAYFLVSLAFDVPFVHLTRFALDRGEFPCGF
jgi:hypothetical protein